MKHFCRYFGRKVNALLILLLAGACNMFFVAEYHDEDEDTHVVIVANVKTAAECGNDPGNGDEIINGPTEPDLLADRDSVFRSLTVHPDEPNVVWVGSARNGILKSTDGGATWTRQRQ